MDLVVMPLVELALVVIAVCVLVGICIILGGWILSITGIALVCMIIAIRAVMAWFQRGMTKIFKRE